MGNRRRSFSLPFEFLDPSRQPFASLLFQVDDDVGIFIQVKDSKIASGINDGRLLAQGFLLAQADYGLVSQVLELLALEVELKEGVDQKNENYMGGH